jgi:hypothetical protein
MVSLERLLHKIVTVPKLTPITTGFQIYCPDPTPVHGLLRGQLYYFICKWCLYFAGNAPIHLHGLLWEQVLSFICRYVRASQETHLETSTVCYEDSFTFLYVDMFVPHRKHTYRPPRPVTGTALPVLLRYYYNPILQHPVGRSVHVQLRFFLTPRFTANIYTTLLLLPSGALYRRFGEFTVSVFRGSYVDRFAQLCYRGNTLTEPLLYIFRSKWPLSSANIDLIMQLLLLHFLYVSALLYPCTCWAVPVISFIKVWFVF